MLQSRRAGGVGGETAGLYSDAQSIAVKPETGRQPREPLRWPLGGSRGCDARVYGVQPSSPLGEKDARLPCLRDSSLSSDLRGQVFAEDSPSLGTFRFRLRGEREGWEGALHPLSYAVTLVTVSPLGSSGHLCISCVVHMTCSQRV